MKSRSLWRRVTCNIEFFWGACWTCEWTCFQLPDFSLLLFSCRFQSIWYSASFTNFTYLSHILWLCNSTEEIYWLSSRKISLSCRNRNSPSRELTAKVCRLVVIVVVVFIMPDCFRFTRTLTWNWSVTSDKKRKSASQQIWNASFLFDLVSSVELRCEGPVKLSKPSHETWMFLKNLFPMDIEWRALFLKFVMKDSPWALHNQLSLRILHLINMTYWFSPIVSSSSLCNARRRRVYIKIEATILHACECVWMWKKRYSRRCWWWWR